MSGVFGLKLAAAAAFLLAIAGTEVSAVKVHPSLLTTPEGVELARQRVREEQWARNILDRLTAQAAALEREELPVFEKDWWEEAGRKHWSGIYPEVNRHTMFAVAGPVAKARDAAMAYALTGEAKHAGLVRKVLLHYTAYEFFAVHPDVGLNWSIWCMHALQSYDLIYDILSEADRTKIDDFFRRALEAIRRNDEWWIRDNMGGLFNNHYAWHKLFIGSCGLFYGRPELVDYAMESNQGIRELIENGSRDDGLWLESSLNYQFTAIIPLAEFARQLANSGSSIDLWNRRFANGRSLRELFTGPIGVLFADETIPTIGDTYGRRMRLGDMGWYYHFYDACRLPEVAWLLRDNDRRPADVLFLEHLPGEAAPPPMRTRIWPEHGYIALRTQEGVDYWRGEGYSVFLSFESNGIHSHLDKFGMTAFGRGRHIAIDPEALASAQHAFSAQIQGELNRSTLCHNTVMVDGRNHNSIANKLALIDFIDSADLKLATIADERGAVYPGVRMMRTVAVTGDYIVDIFQVASEDEHTYDYLFHSYDDNGAFAVEGDSAGEPRAIDLGSDPPWKWLRNAREWAIDGDWWAIARQGSLTTRLAMAGEPGTRLVTCEFPSKDTFEKPAIPMLMARRTAKRTVFVGVLQAEAGDMPDVKISVEGYRHGLLRVKLDCGGTVREFSVRRI